MLIDFRQPGQWQQLNELVKAEFPLGEKQYAKVFSGLGGALVEVTQGLVKLFPHKKKIFYPKNFDPFFEEPMKNLAKEGLKVLPLDHNFISDIKWLDDVDREALMVLLPEDDAFCGEVFDISGIAQALEEKRVFALRVSHKQFLRAEARGLEGRYQLRLLSLAADMAVALHTDKAKVNCPVAESQNWGQEDLEKLRSHLAPLSEDKDRVKKFEASKAGDFQTFFNEDRQRLYDRVTVFWEDMDSFAFIDELAKRLELSLEEPGAEVRFESASLTRWGGVRTMDWLKTHGLNEKAIRGLLTLHLDFVNDDLEQHFTEARKSVLKLQSGEE